MPLYHKEKYKIKGLKINWDELDLVSLLTINTVLTEFLLTSCWYYML